MMGKAVCKIVNIGLILFFGVFLLIALRAACTAEVDTASAVLMALGGVTAAGAAMLLMRLFGRRPRIIGDAGYIITIAAVFTAIFVLQCYVGWNMRSDLYAERPIYMDVQYLHNGATELIHGEEISKKWYFAAYPHQMGPLYFYAGWYKLAELISGRVPESIMIAVNILFTDVGLLFLVLTSNRIAGRRRTIILAVLMLLFLPLYTYMPFMYFDTMVLPFITAPIYLYVCFAQNIKQKRAAKIIEIAAIGLLFGIGTALRRTVAIPAIAVALHMIWRYRKSLLKGLYAIAAMVTVIAIVVCAVGFAGENIVSKEEREKTEIPRTHWVMMSLKTPHSARVKKDIHCLYPAMKRKNRRT